MIAPKITINDAKFQRAMNMFLVHGRRNIETAVREVARGLIRRLIAQTPPSYHRDKPDAKTGGMTTATATKADQRKGERAIEVDLWRIFFPASDEFIEKFLAFTGGSKSKFQPFGHKGAAALGMVEDRLLSYSQMNQWHWDRRSRRTGRVAQISRAGTSNRERALQITTGLRRGNLRDLDIGIVRTSDFQRYLKTVQKNVGMLAAGWNASALALGYNPPSWILRHGTQNGQISISFKETGFSLNLSNRVAWSANVKTFHARVKNAAWDTAVALEKRVTWYLSQAAGVAKK